MTTRTIEVKVDGEEKAILLKIPSLSELESIDVEKITKIRHDNIYADAITFPVMLNRLGMLLAEADSMIERSELDYRIERASLSKEIRKKLTEKGEKVTNDVVDQELR
jgi:hypothetical protein